MKSFGEVLARSASSRLSSGEERFGSTVSPQLHLVAEAASCRSRHLLLAGLQHSHLPPRLHATLERNSNGARMPTEASLGRQPDGVSDAPGR